MRTTVVKFLSRPSKSTIFALCSGTPPSGVAVIRISGPESESALRALTRQSPERPLRPRHLFFTRIYGSGVSGTVEVLDEAMAVWMPGPRSFTGEDTSEVFLHGSKAVVQAVCDQLGRFDGLRPAKSGEFTRRAYFNGKMSFDKTEALADLLRAETQAQRRLAQRQGRVGEYLTPLRGALIRATARLEASIDFAEDVEGQAGAGHVGEEVQRILDELRRFQKGARRGTLIREGVHVAVIGRTNAGKSSIVNQLAEKEVAIVSEHSGTTRDAIETRIDLHGVPITITDTAGFRETLDPIETEGIRRSAKKAAECDLVLLVVDLTTTASDTGTIKAEIEGVIAEAALDGSKPVVIVLNKADLIDANTRQALQHELSQNTWKTVWTSCLDVGGLDVLVAHLDAEIGALVDGEADEMLLSHARHVHLLDEAVEALVAFQRDSDFDVALAAEHLRVCADAIGEITGAIVNEDVLDALFSQFCIGK